MNDLEKFLNSKAAFYNNDRFIPSDPISVPHRFSGKQDIEIASFFAAIFSWGKRSIIINKANELMRLMDEAPYQFITEHEPTDLKRLLAFKHRTFNTTDLLYFIERLRLWYSEHASLEDAILSQPQLTVKENLSLFYHLFFDQEDFPQRTVKHIATPDKKSHCKRLNMLLRWMVRKDNNGVDFGIWSSIAPAKLIIPMDVHVARVAQKLALVEPKAPLNWQAAEKLTEQLAIFDPSDPVKYDFALFGLGIEEHF